MDLRDFVVTPVVVELVYVIAFLARPHLTNQDNRRFFFPALTLRIFGAIALGFLYQFYYSGGDTFNFHTHGSRHIWEAFWDSPYKGSQMLFSDGKHQGNFYQYSSRIYFFSNPASDFVIPVPPFLSPFPFSTYSTTTP